MSLRWLDFDYSEGDDDTGVFDALASVELGHVAEVQAEIDAVLGWAEATFAGCRGPVEDGGEWDAELQVSNEDTNPPRRYFSLAVGGTRAFCQALAERFG